MGIFVQIPQVSEYLLWELGQIEEESSKVIDSIRGVITSLEEDFAYTPEEDEEKLDRLEGEINSCKEKLGVYLFLYGHSSNWCEMIIGELDKYTRDCRALLWDYGRTEVDKAQKDYLVIMSEICSSLVGCEKMVINEELSPLIERIVKNVKAIKSCEDVYVTDPKNLDDYVKVSFVPFYFVGSAPEIK